MEVVGVGPEVVALVSVASFGFMLLIMKIAARIEAAKAKEAAATSSAEFQPKPNHDYSIFAPEEPAEALAKMMKDERGTAYMLPVPPRSPVQYIHPGMWKLEIGCEPPIPAVVCELCGTSLKNKPSVLLNLSDPAVKDTPTGNMLMQQRTATSDPSPPKPSSETIVLRRADGTTETHENWLRRSSVMFRTNIPFQE